MRRTTCLLLAVGLAGCEPLRLDPFLYGPLPAPPEGYRLPTEVIPRHEDLWVDTRDGERLHVAYVPAVAGAPAGRGPLRTLVYFHGQNSHIGKSWRRIEYLYPLGHEIYAVDPRGYGRSSGTPSEPGLQIDLADLHRFLTEVRGVPPGRLVYYGRSLGGAFAIHLASVAPGAALITESAFTSVAALVRDGAFVDLPAHFVADSVWDNVGKLRAIRIPYLVLHGTADDYVQFRYAGELARAHGAGAELEPVVGADHGNLPEVMPLARYVERIARFLAGLLLAPAPPLDPGAAH